MEIANSFIGAARVGSVPEPSPLPNKLSYSGLASEFDCVLEDIIIPMHREVKSYYQRYQNAPWFYGIQHPLDTCCLPVDTLVSQLGNMRRAAIAAAASRATADQLAALNENTCDNLLKLIGLIQTNLVLAVGWLTANNETPALDGGTLSRISSNFCDANRLESSFSVSMQSVPVEKLPTTPPQHTELTREETESDVRDQSSSSSLETEDGEIPADQKEPPVVTIDSDTADEDKIKTNFAVKKTTLLKRKREQENVKPIGVPKLKFLQERKKCIFCEFKLNKSIKRCGGVWRQATMLGHVLRKHPQVALVV